MSHRYCSILNWFRKTAKVPTTGVAIALLTSGLTNTVQGATIDWGVSESGLPGTYTWQHLYNWNATGLHQTPLLIPNAIGDIANLNLVNLSGNQTINLDGAVTLGTLNIGDISGQQSYIIGAGTGGTLTFNNGGTAAINKSGIATDVITSNIVLTNPVTIDVADGRLALTGVLSGAGGITKNGNGTLVLRGVNTFTGVSTLNGGITLIAPFADNGAVLGASGVAQGTVVNSGATLAIANDQSAAAGLTGGGASNAEPLTINGQGFRNQGALRNMFGRETNQFTGVVTLGSASRIQSDAGTLQLTGALNVNQDVMMGGSNFVQLSGAVSGSNTITHYGSNGFQLSNITAGQTYSGTINSLMGEIRSNTVSGATAADNPYNDIAALNLRNSVLRLNFASGAGGAGNAADSRFSTTAPISMMGSQIYIDNAAFNATSTNLFDYAVAQTFGTTTMQSGHNRFGFRSADTGTVTMTFTNIVNPNPGTTMELHVDNLSGAALGTAAKHRILNTALEGGSTVPFVGGWAYSAADFLKYVPTGLGGFGYTELVAADNAVNQSENTWASGQNIFLDNNSYTIAANRTIQSLKIAGATDRIVGGAPGTILEIESGGIITLDDGHIISVPTLTAGAAGNYTLYDIAWSFNTITSVIADNAGNAVSLVKTGGNTSRFLGNNSYTGSTYINEGMFQDIIGANNQVALGSGNLVFSGGQNNQAVYENDNDFIRALGTGPGEVQFIGGGAALGSGSTGLGAYGAPIDINFGGAAASVTWGSAAFNPGVFTLNGGNATHVATMINPIDLGGEQRYIRLDGSASGGNRAVLGTITGDISNGGLVRRGGGVLFFDTAKTYEGSTIIAEGEIWLRKNGTLGANVTGNDIFVNAGARLLIDAPSNIGSKQLIALQNNSDDTPVAIGLGAGYGSGSGIAFTSLTNNTTSPTQTGGSSFLIVNQQTGTDARRANRLAIQLSGNHNFSSDLLAQVKSVTPDVQAWFGADSGNGTYTGATLTATGRTKTGGNFEAHRLGSGGGTITIANSNVLTGAVPLVVGAEDNTGRTNIGGLVWLPNAQNYTGTVAQTVGTALTAGNLIGSGGILVVGQNGALNAANNNLSIRGGELRLGVNPLASHYGQTDTQYSSRNIFVKSANAVFRTLPTGGGIFGTVTLNDFTMRMDDADRAFSVNRIGTTWMNTVFNGAVSLENGATDARSAFFDIGDDNNHHSGIGNLTFNGVISQTGAASVSLQKRNGGVLILGGDNTYNGSTNVQQGRLVLANVGAAGNAASTINLNTNNDRRSDLEFRLDGAGPFVVNNTVATTGGNDGSTRVITVGSLNGSSSNQVVQIPTLTIGHAGAYTTNGGTSSSVYFDGFNGYELEITGNLNLTRTAGTVLRPRGAMVTVSGVITGAAAALLEKSEQGTLWLSGNNTYAGDTVLSNGYLVVEHDNALGIATTAVNLRNNSFSQLLASGVRTINRNFINTGTGSSQTLGGLDAGAKVFSGGINLSTRGLNLTAATGGDTSFTGTISGAFGITKVGNGTVILNPTSGGNTFNTGGVTVSQGTLVGEAKTGGNPFGTNNPFTLANGTLRLNNNTGAVNATTTTGALNITTGNASLVVDSTGAGGNATTLTFGSLVRTNSSSLVLKGMSTDLGGATNEIIAFTAAPTPLNGTIGTWAAIQASGSNAAHYAGVSGSNIVTATYTASGVDLDTAAGATNLLDISGGTLTADRSVYAFRTAAAGNVALGGFTLRIGAPNSGTAGEAGMILNGGADVTGGTVNFGTNTLAIYADDAAVSTLGAALTNYRNNTNNTLANRLVKFGPGTLELSNANNNFQGNVQVNQGILSLTAANVMPTFANLNAVTGSTVTIQPGASVVINNNNQEFGNLAGTSVVSVVQNTGGTLDLGTATLVVGRQGSDQTFSGQLIGGAGSKITKIGAGRLTLDNYNTSAPNSLATLDIAQGVVTTWNNDQTWSTPTGFASSIPSSTTVLLRGGEWEVRSGGDSTSNFQVIPIGNSIVHGGGNSTFDTDRFNNGSNKILTFNNLTLDKELFLATGGNAIYPRFDGTITLVNHARVQTDAPLLLNGPITGNYTLTKTGGSNLEIGANNSTWSGGTVMTDGFIAFGTRAPEDASRYMAGTNLFASSATANLGTGDIVINRNSAIRITAPSNILSAQGQRVQVFGDLRGNLSRIDVGLDAPITDYSLRSTGNGALNLGLHDGFFSNTIDQSRLGNGKWGVGAWDTTFYTAATMGAGADNTFRFLGTNSILGVTQTNALSGSASLWVGAPQYDNGFALANTSAQIRLYGDQSYTGNTIIFRSDNTGNTNNFLTIHGDSLSPVYDVFGRLEARGDGRFTRDDGSQFNTVNLYPGSSLRLDYNMDVNDSMLISRLDNSNLGLETDENKWGDTTGMTLRGATLYLVSSNTRQNQERIGAMTVEQGAAVLLERTGTNGQMVLSTPSITRVGQATFDVRENADELGRVDLQGQKFFIDNGASMLDAQNMLPAWMINPSRNTFLTYNASFGVQNKAFTQNSGAVGTGAAFLAGLTATDIASYGTTTGDATLTGTANVWALRISHEAASNDTTLTSGQINIHSGGLIVDNRDNARVNFDTTAVYFGNGSTPVEGIIYSDQSGQTTRIGGVVTAANLTHNGAGQLQLTNVANAITGNIQMNGGTLFADGAGTLGTASVTVAGNWLGNNDGQQMAEIRLRTNNSVNTTYNNPIIVAADLPYARIFAERYTGTSTAGAVVTIPSLSIGGTNTIHGTSLIINNSSSTNSANTHDLTVSGATSIGGSGTLGLHVQARTLRLVDVVTATAPIIKSGDGVLRLDGNNDATLSSPITVNRGELRLTAPNAAGGASQAEGTGPLTMNFGTLRLAAQNITTINSTTTFLSSANQHLTIAGAVTIGYDRNGGTPASGSNNVTIGAAGLEFRTINSPYVIFDALTSFGDGLRIASETVIRDQPFFRITDHNLFFNNIIRGGGTMTRGEAYLITFNNNAPNPNWSGGFTALQGYNRVTQANTNFTFGTGQVNVGPTAVLSLNSLSNIAGSAVSNFNSGASTPVLIGVSQGSLFTTANLNSLFPAANNTSRPGVGGIIGLDSVTTSTAFNLATFQDGYWSLGANIGGATYTGDAGSLTAGAGNVYRLGGGGTSITIDPTTAGSKLFTGVGAQVQIGRPDAWHSAGYNASMVVYNNDLDADNTGGTTIGRARDIGGGWYQVGLVVNGGNPTATTYRTPLGTGQTDVYGHLRFASANGGLVNAAGANYTNIVLHTGSRLTFDNRTAFVNAAAEGRYDNQASLTLNGAQLQIRGTNNINTSATNREDIGELIIQRGSHLHLNIEGTGYAGLGVDKLTRGTNGTLTIYSVSSPNNNTLTAQLLGANTAAGGVNMSANFLVTNPANVPTLTNNMVDPWIVSRTEDQFLKYDNTNGFQVITVGTAPSNYISSTATTLDGAVLTANNGTEILSAEAGGTITLGANLDVYAMRIQRNLDQSANGAFSNVTIRSGGLIFLANSPVINANLDFGLGGASEALIYSAQSTSGINGQIRASQVTKFGRGFLDISSSQPLFSGSWVVNEGGLRFRAPGSTGTGTNQIILNGSTMSDDADRRDGGASFIDTVLRYEYNSGTPDEFAWNHGKVTSYNNNLIYATTASDRNMLMPDIDLRTTATAAGGLHNGLVRFQVDGSRSTLRTGTVTLFDNYMVYVNAGSFGPGSTAGVKLGALNNGAAFDLIKTGDGVLTLIDNAATFTGNRFTYVDEGAVRVLSNGSFGAAGNTAVISQGGALEVAVTGFAPLATLDQRPGSIERWAVDGARSGAVSLPAGVHLQVMHSQTGTQTINLNGGSIMGYLPLDWDQVAVIHTLGSGVTVNLTGDSFLGQPFPANATAIYDMGKLNSTTNLNPSDPLLSGSYLQIDGAITGVGGLTKVGQDMILLNGANTYGGATVIKNGILQIGRNNSLPVGTALAMKGSSGMFDLNGYNQEVAALSGDAGSINNGAFADNSLVVNQTSSTTYAGTIDGNVIVHKKGAGTLTFTPVSAIGSTLSGNSYRGGTILEAGKLSISQDNALGWTQNVADADNLRFTGGTLQTTANLTLHSNRGLTLDSAGGTLETATATTAQVAGVVTGAGSFTKTGAGILQFNNVGNNYTGNTNVTEGTLQGGAADTLAPLSRHVVTGDAASGTLSLNGFDQTIGSLSSTGATQANAQVALGSNMLTVGADGTMNAVYAGTITGTSSSVFRVNGNGAVQTLSTLDNSAQVWNTQIANGVLNVANGAKLSTGTADVQMGITGVSGADDFTGLNLSNTAAFANNITVNNVNTVGSAAITSTGANAVISGTIALNRNIYAGAATGTQLSLEGIVSGNGTITVVDGGALRLTSANTYGTGVAGTSGTTFAGGTVVRAGTVLLENNTAAGSNVIAIGDQTNTIGAAVDRVTFSSILGSGSFNPNGDGVSATTGGQSATGTTGFGAFIGVTSTVDGNTYTSGDVGTRILVAGEEANPERNGIYTIVSVTGGTMNLVRADDFETGSQMKYGGQVAVTNGTYAGQTMFQFEEQVVVRNETTLEPIRFRQDVVNPNLSVLQNVSGLSVANNINVNATNGSGTMTVGGSTAVTTGTGTFSGNVQLANVVNGTAETKAVRLASSTTSTNGIVFSGVISEADTTAVTGDTLSVSKVDAGTVTLSGVNTFRGTTSVTEGRLQVGNGGAAGTGSIVGAGGTVGAVSVTGAGTTLASAPVLAGGSGNTVIGGATTIGTATNPGILAPGIGDSATNNQTMTFSSTSGITAANGSQLQMSITTPTLNASNGTVSAWLTSNQDLNTYLTANPSSVSLVNIAPATYGDMDYINLTGGTLSLGTRSSGTFGNGSLLIQDNGWLSGAAAGDLFNLFDWVSAMTGTFSTPGTLTTGGAYGDIDLPTLSGTLSWDLSALSSHGIAAVVNVVPEPSRALLILLGMFGLLARRRRSGC